MDNNIKNRVLNYIEENKKSLFELLSELIKINSENFGSKGNEKEMAEFVSEKLKKLGIDVTEESVPNTKKLFVR